MSNQNQSLFPPPITSYGFSSRAKTVIDRITTHIKNSLKLNYVVTCYRKWKRLQRGTLKVKSQVALQAVPLDRKRAHISHSLRLYLLVRKCLRETKAILMVPRTIRTCLHCPSPNHASLITKKRVTCTEQIMSAGQDPQESSEIWIKWRTWNYKLSTIRSCKILSCKVELFLVF